jgi:peptidoglycan/xylan/chitin deacetylase (PgdA/CDA1 family)
MYVFPDTLALHLGILKRHFELVHLDDWMQSARRGAPVPRLACALTFDDGWRDNFLYAFPILKAQAVPATIYLLPDLMGTRYSFWPNRLARLLADAGNNPLVGGWPGWLREEIAADGQPMPLPLPMARIDALIEKCKAGYTDEGMLDLLHELDSGRATDDGQRDLLSWDEAAEMAASGLIRFGSHTRRHIRLDARVRPEVLQEEIRQSRAAIEQRLGVAVNSFCYPNGDHCPAAVELVRGSYLAAVTTRKGWNSPVTDAHLLNRVGVHEDVAATAAAFIARLTLP